MKHTVIITELIHLIFGRFRANIFAFYKIYVFYHALNLTAKKKKIERRYSTGKSDIITVSLKRMKSLSSDIQQHAAQFL